MPTYQHKCAHCKAKAEIDYPMKFVGKEEDLPLEIWKEINCNRYTCKHKDKKSEQYTNEIWPRIPYSPHIANQLGGTTVSEKTLLKQKQESLKQRARAHTANEGYKDIKDLDMKDYIKKKYKNSKFKDHEKMKPK